VFYVSVCSVAQRNAIGFYEIGCRSHLELRSFIETCIRAGSELSENEVLDAATLEKEERDIAKLPQIIFY
jgi:hypothetical protein